MKGKINHHIGYIKEQVGEQLSSQINNMLERFCTSGTYDLEKILERLNNANINDLEETHTCILGSHNNTSMTTSDVSTLQSRNNLESMLNYVVVIKFVILMIHCRFSEY